MKNFLANLSPLSCVDMGLLYRIGDYGGAISQSIAYSSTLTSPESKEESRTDPSDLLDFLIEKTQALTIQCISSAWLEDPIMARACILSIADLQQHNLSAEQKKIYIEATECAKKVIYMAACYIKIESVSGSAHKRFRIKNISRIETFLATLEDPLTDTDTLIHFIRQLMLYYLQAYKNREQLNPVRFASTVRQCRQRRLDRLYLIGDKSSSPKNMPAYRSDNEASHSAICDFYDTGMEIVRFYLLLAEKESDRGLQQTFAEQALEELNEIANMISDVDVSPLQIKTWDVNTMQDFFELALQKAASATPEESEGWLPIALNGARIAFWKGWTSLARNGGQALDYLLQGKCQLVKDLIQLCEDRDEEEKQLSAARAELMASLDSPENVRGSHTSARHRAKKKLRKERRKAEALPASPKPRHVSSQSHAAEEPRWEEEALPDLPPADELHHDPPTCSLTEEADSKEEAEVASLEEKNASSEPSALKTKNHNRKRHKHSKKHAVLLSVPSKPRLSVETPFDKSQHGLLLPETSFVATSTPMNEVLQGEVSLSQDEKEPLCHSPLQPASPVLSPSKDPAACRDLMDENHSSLFFHDPVSNSRVESEEKVPDSSPPVADEPAQHPSSGNRYSDTSLTLFKPAVFRNILQPWGVSLPQFLVEILSQIEAFCDVKAFIVGSFAELLVKGEQPDCRRDIDIVLIGAPSLDEKWVLGKKLQSLYPTLHACHVNGLGNKLFQLEMAPWKIELFASDATGSLDVPEESIAKDASTRDFTKSAIYISKEGYVFDPVQGIRDSLAGLIRAVSSPLPLLQDDPARALRAIYKHLTEGCRLHYSLETAIQSFTVPQSLYDKPEYYSRIHFITYRILSRLDVKEGAAFIAAMEYYQLGRLFSRHNRLLLPGWIYNAVPMNDAGMGNSTPAALSR